MKQLFLFLLICMPGWTNGQTNVALNLTPPQRQALDRAISLAFPDEKTEGTDWLNLNVYAAAMDALGALVDERVLEVAQRHEGDDIEAKFIVLAWEKRTHPERISGVYEEFMKFVRNPRSRSQQVNSPSVTKDGEKWVTPDYRLTWEYYLAMPVSFPRNQSSSKAPEALGHLKDVRSLVLYLSVARRAAAGRVGTFQRVRGSYGMLDSYLESALEYRTVPALTIAVKIMYMRYANPAVSEEFEGDANFSRASGYKRAWIREKQIKDWKPIARQVSREGLTAEENGFLDWVLAQPD